MSVKFDRSKPVFKESRWIVAEDLNTEHLLDVFTSVDANASEVLHACVNFIAHLHWHKPRRTVLSQKIEDLPDNYRHKTKCLFELASLFYMFGNNVEQKRLLNHILEPAREGGTTVGLLNIG